MDIGGAFGHALNGQTYLSTVGIASSWVVHRRMTHWRR